MMNKKFTNKRRQVNDVIIPKEAFELEFEDQQHQYDILIQDMNTHLDQYLNDYNILKGYITSYHNDILRKTYSLTFHLIHDANTFLSHPSPNHQLNQFIKRFDVLTSLLRRDKEDDLLLQLCCYQVDWMLTVASNHLKDHSILNQKIKLVLMDAIDGYFHRLDSTLYWNDICNDLMKDLSSPSSKFPWNYYSKPMKTNINTFN